MRQQKQEKDILRAQAGNGLTSFLAFAAICAALILTFNPDMATQGWMILSWVIAVAAAILAIVMKVIEQGAAAKAKQEEAKKSAERSEKRAKERAEREAKEQEAREALAQKEAEKKAKRAEERAARAAQAAVTWAARAELATKREATARQALARAANHPAARDAAARTAAAWAAAATLAKWSAQETESIVNRPETKGDAREELREAEQEAARIRERGAAWTDAQAEALLAIRERARAEAKVADDREEKTRLALEKAETEWKTAEVRAERAENDWKTAAAMQG